MLPAHPDAFLNKVVSMTAMLESDVSDGSLVQAPVPASS